VSEGVEVGVPVPSAETASVADGVNVFFSVGVPVAVSVGITVADGVTVAVPVGDAEALAVGLAEAVPVTVGDTEAVSPGVGVTDGVGVMLGRAVGKIKGACVGVGARTIVGRSRTGPGLTPLMVGVGVLVGLAGFSSCLLRNSDPVPRQYSADAPRMATSTSARRIRLGVHGDGICVGSVGRID
jgi:hypothetical protein